MKEEDPILHRENHLSSSEWPSGADCPTAEDLALLVCGELEESAVPSVMEHIAKCNRCGFILRSLLDDTIQSDPLPVQVLKPADQQPVAPLRKRHKPIFQARPSIWIGIAALLVLALASSLLWLRRQNQPQVLLAKAYTADRPFMYRLPDAGYGAVKQQRDAASSIFNRSEAFSLAEAKIQERLKARPEDYQGLLLKGRAEMLAGQYYAAIKSLNEALDKKPSDPKALSDLGVAYALLGDSEGDASSYGHAIELLMRSLRLEPKQAIAVFNLALVYERMSDVDDAIAAWKRYLQLDPSSQWSGEARQQLANLEETKKARSDLRGRVTNDASRFVALAEIGREADAENYLSAAWTRWLPDAQHNPDALKASQLLAEMLLRKSGDTALDDAVRDARQPSSSQGMEDLADAIAKDSEGQADDAVNRAHAAADALKSAHCRAATLRARVEELYGLYRSTHYSSCIEFSKNLETDLNRTTYKWMQAMTMQAESDCLAMSGDLGRADARAHEAYSLAFNSGYRILTLRALSFTSNQGKSLGNHRASWRAARQGLQLFWTSDAPEERRYQFSFDLADSANLLGWRETAVVFARDAIRASAQMQNRLIAALGRVHFAAFLEAAGYRSEAARELKSADEEFGKLNPTKTVQTYRIDARLARARLELNGSDPTAVLNELKGLNNFPFPQLRQDFDLTYGLALLKVGQFREGQSALLAATQIYEEESNSLASMSDRTRAAARIAPAFRALVRSQFVDNRDSEQSLRTWERFRASLAASPHPSGDGPARASRHDETILVYAALDSDVIAWSIDDEGIEARFISNAGETRAVAARFLRMCSSPDSNLRDLRDLGQNLYRTLLKPFSERLLRKRAWYIEADGWLSAIPFSAVVDDSGEYLQSRHPIAFVDSLRLPQITFDRVSFAATARVEVAAIPAVAANGSALPYLASANREASDIARHFVRVDILTGASATKDAVLRGLASADVFHFAGHGLLSAGNAALSLAPSAPGAPSYFTASSVSESRQIACSLVVLAACNTAIGEQEGPYEADSLVRAFLFGGVKQVIATRWNVDDDQTSRFMDRFYSTLSQRKIVADALALAAREMLINYPHPYFWAGFQIFEHT